jgi:hypothetical protein
MPETPSTPDQAPSQTESKLGSLLLSSMVTISQAIARLTITASDLRDNSKREFDFLKDRIRYFKIIIAINFVLLVLNLIIIGGIYYTIKSGEDRGAEIELILKQTQFLIDFRAVGLHGQECIVRAIKTNPELSEEAAVAKYKQCAGTKIIITE